MEKQRYNPLNQIHKGLRMMMYETGIALQHSDFSMEESAEHAFENVEVMLDIVEDHSSHEEKFILVVLDKMEPDTAASFKEDHSNHHNLGKLLRESIKNWRKSTSNEERNLAGWKAYYLFNEFVAAKLLHMNKEEAQVNPVLWAHFSDHQLLAFQLRIVASIDPAKKPVEFRWMMKGLNTSEIINWLREIRKVTHEAVFQSFWQLAIEEMPLSSLPAVCDAMAEGSIAE